MCSNSFPSSEMRNVGRTNAQNGRFGGDLLLPLESEWSESRWVGLAMGTETYHEAQVTFPIPIDCAIGVGKIDTVSVVAAGFTEHEPVAIARLEAADIMKINMAGIGEANMPGVVKIDVANVGKIGAANATKVGAIDAAGIEDLCWKIGGVITVA